MEYSIVSSIHLAVVSRRVPHAGQDDHSCVRGSYAKPERPANTLPRMSALGLQWTITLICAIIARERVHSNLLQRSEVHFAGGEPPKKLNEHSCTTIGRQSSIENGFHTL